MTIGWKCETPRYGAVEECRAEMVRRFGCDYDAIGKAVGVSRSTAKKLTYSEASAETIRKVRAYLEQNA